MHILSLLLALTITLIWGINFVVVKFCLKSLTPLLLCVFRFLFSSIPAIFFVEPPKVPFKWIFFYGLIMFALQFSFLFLGLYLGMEAGLTSLLLQLQVFLSMFIGIFFFKERVRSWHVLGCAISFLGIGIVIGHISGSFKIIALFPIFGAAICSSIGNLLSKKFNHANSISLVSWGSLVAWPILLVATFCIQGFDSIVSQLQQITPSAVLGICYISYLSTLFAYGTWCWLLANYPLRTITPFTLLTPIFALLSASIFLGEQLFLWKILAAALVITGLAINLFGHHILKIPPPFD